MMSLAKISPGEVVKRQYLFKLRAYANLFLSLVAVQVIALLFTAGGMTGMSGIGSNSIDLEIKFYSGTIIFVFTALWIAVNSFVLMLPLYRNIDFSFITNRISSNLANLCFLVTAAAAGGVTAALSSLLLKNVIYYSGGSGSLIGTHFLVEPGELLTAIAVGSLYLLLFGAAGYLVGALIQLHSSLYVLLPALLLGVLFYEAAHEHLRLLRLIDFFRLETSPALFFLKIMVSVLLMWFGAALISSKTELK